MLNSEKIETHAWRQIEIGQGGNKIHYNRKKEVLLLFDGELFYQQDLRAKLKKSGQSAEELILEAYDQWDEKFLTYLEGDFALAILDKKKMKLLLARDRVGKKPLFWGEEGGHFLFGSELKGLLATGIIPQTPSPEALSTYLAFGYCPQDATLIQHVNKLLPGHFLVLDDFKTLRIESYWSLSSFFASSAKLGAEAVSSTLEHLLKNSIKERVSGKKDVGCILSGGLGSGSVGWFLNQTEPAKSVATFSTCFVGQNEEDVVAAEQYGNGFSSALQVDKITPENFLSPLSDILWKIEEPIADPNLVAAWHLCNMPPRGMTLFSGMGSDELLAGHSRYTLEERELGGFEKFFEALSYKVKKGLIPLFHFFGSNRAYDLLRNIRSSPYLVQYVHQNLLFQRRRLYALSPKLAPLFDPIVFLEKFHNLNKIDSAVSAFIYLDFKTSLPDYYSGPYERLTFASGLHWETPFLDQRVVEFAASIREPEELSQTQAGAYLKRLMHPHFPPGLVDRPKRSRRTFLNEWANDPHILPAFNALSSGTLVGMGFIDRKWVDKAISTPALRSRHFRQLFALLALEEWFRLFILNPVVQK